jgi:hypothetical protein
MLLVTHAGGLRLMYQDHAFVSHQGYTQLAPLALFSETRRRTLRVSFFGG